MGQVPKAIKAEFQGEGAWEISLEVAAKLTHIVAEFIPFAALWRVGKVVYRAAKPEEHKARPDDTDLMQILLDQLRDEKEAFDGLDRMYNEASTQLEQIAQRTRKA